MHALPLRHATVVFYGSELLKSLRAPISLARMRTERLKSFSSFCVNHISLSFALSSSYFLWWSVSIDAHHCYHFPIFLQAGASIDSICCYQHGLALPLDRRPLLDGCSTHIEYGFDQQIIDSRCPVV